MTTNHTEEARTLLYIPLTTTEEGEAALVTATAQVHATLALAEEQRTANLIAFAARSGMTAGEQSGLVNQILPRLGLN